MKKIPVMLTDEKGSVLIIALLFLTLLTLIGIAGIITSSTDTKISGYNLSGTKAFYFAEAGVEEGRKRLKGIKDISVNPNYAGDPATSPNDMWSAYILSSTSWQLSDHPAYNSSFLFEFNYIFCHVFPPVKSTLYILIITDFGVALRTIATFINLPRRGDLFVEIDMIHIIKPHRTPCFDR